MESADAVVIGGGCNGTSIALHLAKRNIGKIILLEKATLAAGGTGRSSALVRQHYTHEALATMALASLHVFQNFEEEIGGRSGFVNTGFLAIVGPEDVEALRDNVAMQQRIGIETHVMTPDEVKQLDDRVNIEDIGAAAFEPQAGYADPHDTTVSFAQTARNLGVEIRQHTRVTGLVMQQGRISEVHTDQGAISTPIVVIAAGYESKELVGQLGVHLPITPVRHAIAIFERPAEFGSRHCIISDHIQRAYIRPEGEQLTLIGSSDALYSSEDMNPEVDRQVDAETTGLFGERLAHRFTGLDDFLIRRGYTGIYDVTPDGQPILGPLPQVEGVYCAFGFSGHGFKLSPVVGKLVTDTILDGHSQLVDIGLFRSTRFAEDDLVRSTYPYSMPVTGSI